MSNRKRRKHKKRFRRKYKMVKELSKNFPKPIPRSFPIPFPPFFIPALFSHESITFPTDLLHLPPNLERILIFFDISFISHFFLSLLTSEPSDMDWSWFLWWLNSGKGYAVHSDTAEAAQHEILQGNQSRPLPIIQSLIRWFPTTITINGRKNNRNKL